MNEEMRREMANLMQQIATHSEQSKVVKESETRVREEKRKVEQQLLVASADKVGVISWHVKSIILLHSTGLENMFISWEVGQFSHNFLHFLC